MASLILKDAAGRVAFGRQGTRTKVKRLVALELRGGGACLVACTNGCDPGVLDLSSGEGWPTPFLPEYPFTGG
jgi:hypothetical protein